jgi:tight adherence protein C
MASSYPILTEEIQLCTLHLQMGKVRSEVLQDLGNRTGVEDLRTLASLLIQADKFGSGVAQALRVQSDSMRIKRQQIAEEKAAKTAVKAHLPVGYLYFPWRVRGSCRACCDSDGSRDVACHGGSVIAIVYRNGN